LALNASNRFCLFIGLIQLDRANQHQREHRDWLRTIVLSSNILQTLSTQLRFVGHNAGGLPADNENSVEQLLTAVAELTFEISVELTDRRRQRGVPAVYPILYAYSLLALCFSSLLALSIDFLH
jgi:hypothetical protein